MAKVFLTFIEAEVIKRIEQDKDTFCVERPAGHVVNLIVADREGRKYVKTEADGDKPDNLLSLPDCPTKRVVTPSGSRGVYRGVRHDA